MLINLLYDNQEQPDHFPHDDFTFMKTKIIRVEALSLFNRIISAMNLQAHWYNQLDLDFDSFSSFTFKGLRKVIACEFLNEPLYSTQEFNKI